MHPYQVVIKGVLEDDRVHTFDQGTPPGETTLPTSGVITITDPGGPSTNPDGSDVGDSGVIEGDTYNLGNLYIECDTANPSITVYRVKWTSQGYTGFGVNLSSGTTTVYAKAVSQMDDAVFNFDVASLQPDNVNVVVTNPTETLVYDSS